jgi:DNA-binding SARP family transcriptional activator
MNLDTEFDTLGARHLVADIDGAIAACAALPSDGAELDPGVAWRLGMVHYLLRGSPRDAQAVLSRGRLSTERTADEALLLSWQASVHWATGDAAQCAELAGRAQRAAEAANDNQARAAAHAALALSALLAGDHVGNATHCARALRYAQAAGDTVQIIRIRLNKASNFLAEASYREALADLEPAVELAETSGNTVLLGLALTNKAAALCALGRFDDALACLHRALRHYQQAGSNKTAFALLGIADVHRRRGQTASARAAYEEAIAIAERDGHQQILAPALARLAMVLLEIDPVQAQAFARRARAEAVGPFATVALLALAQTALVAGDREAAVVLGEEAQASARAHRDRAAVAEALELQAAASQDPGRSRRYLEEARGIWADIGAVCDADRLTVAFGHSPAATPEMRSAAGLAAERLAAAGVPVSTSEQNGDGTGVRIRTLGRFEVIVGAAPVAATAWQSKKARDLLRLLVSRRGRPVSRDELIEALWPDGQDTPQERRAHRLAVALSTLRTVLDAGRRLPADHFIVSGSTSITIDASTVLIDLEMFLGQAEHALRLWRREPSPTNHAALAAVETLYTGDFLEDEPYDDWSAGPREQARTAYLRVARALADHAVRQGDADEASHYLLRILSMDPYDEQCHRALIEAHAQAGRHGQARRAKLRYEAAMRELSD